MGSAPGWIRYDATSRRIALTIHVQPNARRHEITGLHGDALKIRVAAPPVDRKANRALIEFMSGLLGIPKSAVSIRHGVVGRRKVVEIAGGPEVAARLAALAHPSTAHRPRSTPSTSG